MVSKKESKQNIAALRAKAAVVESVSVEDVMDTLAQKNEEEFSDTKEAYDAIGPNRIQIKFDAVINGEEFKELRAHARTDLRWLLARIGFVNGRDRLIIKFAR